MSRRLTLTQSEATSWLDCEARAHLRFERGLVPEREALVGARAGGSAGHVALMGGYAAWAALGPLAGAGEALGAFVQGAAAAFADVVETTELRAGGQFGDSEQLEAAREQLDAVWAGVELYVSVIVRRDVEQYFPVAVEQPFEVPITNGRGDDRYLVRGRGVFDLVLQERGGGDLILRDHKFITSGTADGYDIRFGLDIQTRWYALALRMLFGVDVNTAQFGVATQFGPSLPSVNKDGSVSTARVATTRGIYEDACSRQEIEWMKDPKDPAKADIRYAELRAKQERVAESLPVGLERWCSLHEHVYLEPDLDAARETLYQVARRIRLFRRGELDPQRNARSCSILRCDFNDACVLGGSLVDVEKHALEMGFVVADTRHREVDEERLWKPGKVTLGW